MILMILRNRKSDPNLLHSTCLHIYAHAVADGSRVQRAYEQPTEQPSSLLSFMQPGMSYFMFIL